MIPAGILPAAYAGGACRVCQMYGNLMDIPPCNKLSRPIFPFINCHHDLARELQILVVHQALVTTPYSHGKGILHNEVS